MKLSNIRKWHAGRSALAMAAAGLLGVAGAADAQTYHSADTDKNWTLDAGELEQLFEFFTQAGGVYHWNTNTTPATFAPGPGYQPEGGRHSSDFQEPYWQVDIETELLRAVQLYNAGGYDPDPSAPDGFKPTPMTYLAIDFANGYEVTRLLEVPDGGWSDDYKTNKLVLRRIPRGTFEMGSPASENGRDASETQHAVTLTEDYFIGVFPVTQAQYQKVKGTNPSSYSGHVDSPCYPVEKVSYADAVSFIETLGTHTGLTLSLPTEAQWEHACRAGTTTALNNETELTMDEIMRPAEVYARLAAFARFLYDAAGNTPTSPTVVGSYPANKWGLHDMSGNVFEWCQDYYGGYPSSAETNPTGAASGQRVVRGGAWTSNAKPLRSAARASHAASTKRNDVGFRLCSKMP